ncbi:MAG TPA: DUF2892 domain-containing protein [Clostridiaceae bacterium]
MNTNSCYTCSYSIVVVLLGLYYRNWWGLIGLVPIITGSIRYCPVSHILGISTCDTKKKQ